MCVCVCVHARGCVYVRARGCVYVYVCLWAWKALSYRYFYNLKQLQLSAQRQDVTSWFMCTVYVYAGGKGGRRGRQGGGGEEKVEVGAC